MIDAPVVVDAPVAILLPTRNGARFLAEVLSAIDAQRSRLPFAVAAVDSGSTDGTVELLRRHGVAVRGIAPADFQHGRTRNLLARMAPGAEYLVYLSQDATPLPGWLDALVGAVARGPDVAGAFSRQVPRPDCDPFVARRMREEWPQVGGDARVVKRLRPGTTRADHASAHFANTSACVRRSVWHEIPFPEVDFGEDVAWARRVLAKGYALVYEPDSRVLHSHSGSLYRRLRENVDHGRAMRAVLADPDGPDPALMAPPGGVADRVRRDLAYISSLDAPATVRLGWLLYAPAWYAVSVGGQWLGRHAEQLPAWLAHRLSWQAAAGGGRRARR